LNRGRHLYSAGRPSRWALAHISSPVYPACNVGVLWPNGWMVRMPLEMGVDLGPGRIVLDEDPASPKTKGGTAPNFWPMSVVAKQLDGSRRHLVRT